MYERFVASLQSCAASDRLTVVPNARLIGCITGSRRQVDVLVDSRVDEDVRRRVIVDAKMRRRKVNVVDVEAFIGMLEDCAASHGVLVCTAGFTAAAKRRAQDHVTMSIVPVEDLALLDLTTWEPCLGSCRARRRKGLVLYGESFGLSVGDSALSVVCAGKCDECNDFHVWCWTCGTKFALATESEHHCGCPWFWLTAIEDNNSGVSESVWLLLILSDPAAILNVDRRPLR